LHKFFNLLLKFVDESGKSKINYRESNTKPLLKTTFCGKILIIVNGEKTEKQEMKAKVYVTLKPSVLDPQGKAIHHSVELLGYEKIEDVRQGKYFEIALDANTSETDARQTAERIAKNVLANPVIEDYKVEIVN